MRLTASVRGIWRFAFVGIATDSFAVFARTGAGIDENEAIDRQSNRAIANGSLEATPIRERTLSSRAGKFDQDQGIELGGGRP